MRLESILPSQWVPHVRFAFAFMCVTTVVALAAAFILPKKFRAEVLLVPTINESRAEAGLSVGRSGVGALASKIGLGLGSMSGDGAPEVAATLKSRAFVQAYISERQLLPILFADAWDAATQTWTVEEENVPTLADGFRKLSEDVLSVKTDIQTGLVTVQVEWTDPVLAAQWANELVQRVNELMRAKALDEGQRTLSYLRAELEHKQPIEVQQSIFDLVESTLTRVSIAKGREEYAFRVIDPAAPPQLDEYTSPKRGVIILAGAVLGAFLGAMVSLLRAEAMSPG